MNTPKKPKTAPQNMHDAVKTALDKTATQKKTQGNSKNTQKPLKIPEPFWQHGSCEFSADSYDFAMNS